MSDLFSREPTDEERASLRAKLLAARQALPDRLERAVQLQNVLRVWLVSRKESAIGGYWPIKGEFDPLPALYRWSEAADERRIGLPVADRITRTLKFHVWYPGCPMEPDAYDIPKPKDTAVFEPQMVLLPCIGYGPEGVRMGYGGGFYDRTLSQLKAWSVGLIHPDEISSEDLPREDFDIPLNAAATPDLLLRFKS